MSLKDGTVSCDPLLVRFWSSIGAACLKPMLSSSSCMCQCYLCRTLPEQLRFRQAQGPKLIQNHIHHTQCVYIHINIYIYIYICTIRLQCFMFARFEESILTLFMAITGGLSWGEARSPLGFRAPEMWNWGLFRFREGLDLHCWFWFEWFWYCFAPDWRTGLTMRPRSFAKLPSQYRSRAGPEPDCPPGH